MRLVDADAESERLKRDYCEECTRRGNYGIFGAACTPCWVKDAVEEFENAKTVEPEKRRGRWENPTESKPRMFERYGHTFVERQCTECERWSIQVAGSITYKFCPHCGVKMERGANE